MCAGRIWVHSLQPGCRAVCVSPDCGCPSPTIKTPIAPAAFLVTIIAGAWNARWVTFRNLISLLVSVGAFRCG
jgi:hypothetical protein